MKANLIIDSCTMLKAKGSFRLRLQDDARNTAVILNEACLPVGRRRIPCQLISDYHCCGWDSSLTLRMTAGTNCCKWDSCLSAGRLQSLPAVGGPAYRQAGLPTDRRALRMTSVRASF